MGGVEQGVERSKGVSRVLTTPFKTMAASSEAVQQIKVVLLGDGTTGKTSLATRISQNNFSKKYDQTLGVDFYLRRLELPGDSQPL